MTPEQIAADVAARYGLPVSPDAVKIIPPGKMATCPEYRWNGYTLALVDGTTAKDAMRKAINARWRQYEHAKRLERAAKAERPKAIPQQVVKAQARKLQIMHFAKDGKTAAEVAQFMGVSRKTAYKYCKEHGIPVVMKARSKEEDKKRLARVRKFAAKGDKTLAEIAAFLGVQRNSIDPYVHRNGIPYITEKAKRERNAA